MKTTVSTSYWGVNFKSNPKLNEAAELTFVIVIDEKDWLANPCLENAKAWIEFRWTNPDGSYLEAKQSVFVPVSDVVVSRDTSWQGNYKDKGHLELHCTVQFLEAGIWRVEGFFTGDGWAQPLSGYKAYAIDNNTSVQIYGHEVKTSPLAYLANFDYGFLKDKRKIDFLNDTTFPVILELDIYKAPKVGKQATLTCIIASLHDVSDFSASINFYNDQGYKSNSADFLVTGALTWQGDLKQGVPVVFSAVIKFSGEGNWKIYGEGNSQENITNYKAAYVDTLDIGILSTMEYFGWKPYY